MYVFCFTVGTMIISLVSERTERKVIAADSDILSGEWIYVSKRKILHFGVDQDNKKYD